METRLSGRDIALEPQAGDDEDAVAPISYLTDTESGPEQLLERAETERNQAAGLQRALAKLERKSCDLMVLNGPSAMDAADNQVEVLDKTGAVVLTLAGSKTAVAKGILRVIQDRLIKR